MTTRCWARTRRRRTASATQHSSAPTATAPAAIAITPAVLVALLTAPSIGTADDARGERLLERHREGQRVVRRVLLAGHGLDRGGYGRRPLRRRRAQRDLAGVLLA